jgi:hypothetical protein
MVLQIMCDQTKENQSPQVSFMEALAGIAFGLSSVTKFVHARCKEFMPTLLALADLKKKLDELPKESKAAMQRALADGWFFGWHDGLHSLLELVKRLNSENAVIDDIMTEYYRVNLGPFTEELTEKYPARERAIKSAFNAHNSAGDGYYLSVPVFIAQADGLLSEIRGKPGTTILSAVGGELQREYKGDAELLNLLYPFLELSNSKFLMSKKERDAEQASGEPFTALNRHQVMHGERSDYGTEINSLKAFSFLVAVGLHLPAVL